MLKRCARLVTFGLLAVVVLAGCKAQTTTPPSATAVTPLISATPLPTSTAPGAYPAISQPAETIYPAINPTLAAYPASTENPYPYPAPTEYPPAYPAPTENPYPYPASTGYPAAYPAPTEYLSAYPQPTEPAQAAYPAPSVSPEGAYPFPTQPPVAYPGPTQPPAVATAPPSAIPGPATPTSSPPPTNTPLPTPTPIPTASPTPELPPPIRTELIASDPGQFKPVSGEVQLVEFFAFWCVACRSQADDIHRLEALYGSRMNFVYLDIDNPANDQFKQALGFRYEPDFFLLDPQGKILHEWTGWIRLEDIRDAIEGALRTD